MEVSAMTLWLIAGALLFAVEVFIFPTMILVFIGCGAITTGVLMWLGIVETITYQLAAFFSGTSLWALVLWAPLKSMYGPGGGGYEDIVGHTATVSLEGLQKGKKGEVFWSGATWNARLDPEGGVEKIDGGAEVKILRVDTGVLIVAPLD